MNTHKTYAAFGLTTTKTKHYELIPSVDTNHELAIELLTRELKTRNLDYTPEHLGEFVDQVIGNGLNGKYTYLEAYKLIGKYIVSQYTIYKAKTDKDFSSNEYKHISFIIRKTLQTQIAELA